MFIDREDAGIQLGQTLKQYCNKRGLVLAIPRGGVTVGYQVANCLNAELSLIIVRKLPFPDNPEAGFGAIAEDGSSFIIKRVIANLDPRQVEKIKQEQKREIQRRKDILRNNQPMPAVKGRLVILVDDGIAMGSTIQAAITSCKKQKAAKIIVAVPVASKNVVRQLKREVDEVVILEQPSFFQAVAQSYQHWYDVSDEEVIEVMRQFSQKQS